MGKRRKVSEGSGRGFLQQERWVKGAVVGLALLLVGGVLLVLTTTAGRQDPEPTASADRPTESELQALAAELSSGDRARIAASLADIPVEGADRAVDSLGSLKAVSFDASTIRIDPLSGAAVVTARLTATDGSQRDELVVLVKRQDRWLVFSSLLPGATAAPTSTS